MVPECWHLWQCVQFWTYCLLTPVVWFPQSGWWWWYSIMAVTLCGRPFWNISSKDYVILSLVVLPLQWIWPTGLSPKSIKTGWIYIIRSIRKCWKKRKRSLLSFVEMSHSRMILYYTSSIHVNNSTYKRGALNISTSDETQNEKKILSAFYRVTMTTTRCSLLALFAQLSIKRNCNGH